MSCDIETTLDSLKRLRFLKLKMRGQQAFNLTQDFDSEGNLWKIKTTGNPIPYATVLPMVYGQFTNPLPVKNLHDLATYKTAVFDSSSSGNLVAAVAGKVIKVHCLALQSQGTVVVNLNNGSGGSSLAEWSFQAREGAIYPFSPYPAHHLITGVNTALYVTLSAAVTTTINCIYTDADAS